MERVYTFPNSIAMNGAGIIVLAPPPEVRGIRIIKEGMRGIM
jgi:hypothetical protein